MADDKPSVSISQLDTAEKLAAKREELETLRIADVKDWSYNRAFYKGDQWVFWNNIVNQIESLPVHDGDKPRWKVRLTANQIQPGVQHYVAQLTKTKPVISATPDSGSYRDICSAEVAQDLYESKWRELKLHSKLNAALTNACLSQGYWKITWDALAGVPFRVLLDPQGKPLMVDDDMTDIYREQLIEMAEQQGLDPKALLAQFEKVIYLGDIRIEVLPGENVLVDPAAEDFDSASYVICKHALDVDEIWSRWKVKAEPNTSPSSPMVPLAFSRSEANRPKTVREVYIMYIKPSPVIPKGRYVVWLEEPFKILEDTPWPYPTRDLPIIQFPGGYRPSSVYDEPIVTQARPLQKELNRTLSQLVQHKDLAIKPQMIAPIGSMREKITDEPGAVFQYQPIQGLAPEWRQPPNLPQSSVLILQDIQGRIDRVFNRIPSARDQLPARVDAGYSIELIQEAVADQISPVIQRLEESLAKAGNLIASLAKQYYTEPRLLRVRGNSGSYQVKKFMNSDLDGGFSFHAEAGTGLPRSRAGRQQRIMEMIGQQVLTPQQGLRYLDLADMKGIEANFQADDDQAYREHEKLIKGVPINPIAVRQAMQQAQQMMSDPTADVDGDGQPDSPQVKQQYAQQIIQQAAVAPTDFENWENHLEIHRLFMQGEEFENLDPDAQQRFVDHFNATYQRVVAVRAYQLSLDPKVAPRVALNMRATSSVPVAKAIMDRTGIQVEDQDVAAPPLESAIYDSVDKPDMDDAGNDPYSDAEKAHTMLLDQEQHQASLAKSAKDLTLADQRQTHTEMQSLRDQQKHALDMHNANEAAAQQRQHAEQLHQEKLKQMRKKPKNKSG